MAVFTNDRVLVYLIDANIDLWALDDKASVNAGCISHKTIQRAGADILFCSRSGAYKLRRSAENGITIEGSSLSEKIDILYRELLASVPAFGEISATYDPDMGQYHIFFPQPGGVLSKRFDPHSEQPHGPQGSLRHVPERTLRRIPSWSPRLRDIWWDLRRQENRR